MKQVFIKLENPNSVHDLVSLLRKKIADANAIIENLKRIRNAEDLELTSWHQEINKAEQTINSLQRALIDMGE